MIYRPLTVLSAIFLTLSTGIAISRPAQASPTPPPDAALKQSVSDNEKVTKGPAEIKRGHVDVGPRIVDGSFFLMARDDTANPPVWRSTDDAVLRVADASRIDVPTDDTYSFLTEMRGKKAYVIPQTQDQNVVWLGWNTQAPEVVKHFPRGADLVFTRHDGPGQVHMFIENGFDSPMPLYDSTKSGEQLVHMEPNTHVHANWVFSDPGAQTISVNVRGTDNTGTKHSYSTMLRFIVGDKGSADEARTMGAAPSATRSTTTSRAMSSTVATASSLAPAITTSNDSSEGAQWKVGGIAGVVIIGAIVTAVVGHSRSKKMRDDVWNEKDTDTSTATNDSGNEPR
ncbi:hypothetical protein FYJ43_10840 [Cutibacterium sp. WCA-380-WT-3A]|uniref:Actinobacterial surface-anchored domain protein n=1 Tax=Cutibacterium porci TaxID=2605781 RepID=A0A7K0J9F8_9ACTN|nr:choice-of-anchor M domain-containing protein [Cutibacterium porci]MSS46500.1 hypothetical protein [Cutibacterium porci]